MKAGLFNPDSFKDNCNQVIAKASQNGPLI